jgi:hypothetical protein
MLHRSTSLIAKTEVCPVWAISQVRGRPAIERLTGHGSRSRFWRAYRTRVVPGRYPGRPGRWCARYWSAPCRDRRQAGGSRSIAGVRESRIMPVLIRLGMPETAVTSVDRQHSSASLAPGQHNAQVSVGAEPGRPRAGHAEAALLNLLGWAHGYCRRDLDAGPAAHRRPYPIVSCRLALITQRGRRASRSSLPADSGRLRSGVVPGVSTRRTSGYGQQRIPYARCRPDAGWRRCELRRCQR